MYMLQGERKCAIRRDVMRLRTAEGGTIEGRRSSATIPRHPASIHDMATWRTKYSTVNFSYACAWLCDR
jgi:hypothetical protein